jgi:hypothetical protein
MGATPEEIRCAFFEYIQSTNEPEVPYRALWRALLDRGFAIRGETPKRQRDAVYGALSSDHRIVKVRPGVFAPRS